MEISSDYDLKFNIVEINDLTSREYKVQISDSSCTYNNSGKHTISLNDLMIKNSLILIEYNQQPPNSNSFLNLNLNFT